DASRELLIQTIRAANNGGACIKAGRLREARGGGRYLAGAVASEDLTTVAGIEELSPRERDVLQILVEGGTNKEIASALLIGGDTVKKHVQNIIAKLGASDRTQAAVKAVRIGLVG
ncbi:MAG: LuxR C-terminal-related transcriptional regulator, partial [Dehalococcoidia bacterium]